MRTEVIGYIRRRADTNEYWRIAQPPPACSRAGSLRKTEYHKTHISGINANHVRHATPTKNSTECKSAIKLVSSWHRAHMAIETVILGKHKNAQSIILHVCTDDSALEKRRATCMQAGLIGYIKRRANSDQYLRM